MFRRKPHPPAPEELRGVKEPRSKLFAAAWIFYKLRKNPSLAAETTWEFMRFATFWKISKSSRK